MQSLEKKGVVILGKAQQFCKEEGCKGKIDSSVLINLRIGCSVGCGVPGANAHPCKKCGRLHWGDGKLVFNRAEQKAFLKNNQIVLK